MLRRGAWLSLVVVAALAGCYEPNIVNGGLECAPSDVCPQGYHCAVDKRCWLNGTGPDGGDTGDGGGGGDLGDTGDMTPGMAPPAPTGLVVTPTGPAKNLSPSVKGNALAGTTVKIYANATCSGTPAASGTAAEFANGVVVTVTANTTTQLAATATDPMSGLTSACSSPVSYTNDNTAPAAPMLTGTTPPSPSASDTMPFVNGSAEAGSTVQIYSDSACAGTVLATGTAADLAGAGIQVSVTAMATTNLYATATDVAGNVSACSSPALPYLEDPTLPPAPTNLATTPMSPSKSVTMFKLTGTSAANTTVTVYTTNNCSGAPVTSGSSTSFASPGFSITVASNSINTYYANATSAANRTGPCSASIKYIEDELAPNTGAAQVRDGTAADIHWQKATTSMDANWLGFGDAASGIASYDYNISSSNACAGDILATSNVGMVTSINTMSLSLADGATYFNCVRAYDGAGNVSGWIASNGVTIDATPPTPGTVKDGTAADQTWTNATTTMDANWSGFADGSGSGIAAFEWNLSSTSGCAGDVVAPMMLGSAVMSQHATGLGLTSGSTYYNCVRAIDTAGNTGPWAPSNGVTVDAVQPVTTAAQVRDGLGADIQFQNSTSGISASWSGFTDALSLIGSYEVNVSSSALCAGDVFAVTSIGLITNTTLAVSLSSGGTYYFCVRARDNANNASGWVASNGVTVDTTLPVAGTVRDGSTAGADVQWQITNASIDGNWSGFTDNSGSIASYDWKVSSSMACADNVVSTVNTTMTTKGATGLSLTNGATYYNCVRAYDAAGNQGMFQASNGVRVDIDLPTTGTVNDGLSGDFAWTKTTNSISSNWTGFADATSGVGSYDHNLSSSTGCTGDVLASSNLMGTSTSRAIGTPLVNGNTYYNCVRVWDVAGNSSGFVPSSGFTVDTVMPSTAGASVLDGQSGADAQYQGLANVMHVRWSGFTDTGGSGIANYDWGLSTASDCSSLVVSQSGIGVSGSFSASSLSLTNGQKYYNCIRAIDVAGNVGNWLASNGITVDTQQPTTAGAVVHDGLSFPPDLQFQTSTTQLSANWSGFTDNTAVASYMYNVSSMPTCTGDVLGNQSTAATSVTISVVLNYPQTYYVCVLAVDVANNQSTFVHSDGVTIDTFAPTSGTVRDGGGADINFQASTTSITGNWMGFSDTVSGIASYNYAVSTHADCSAPVASMSIASTSGSGSQTVSVSLVDGTKYYNCVQAVDAAGNPTSFVRSDGVTIDGAKPTGGSVSDGPIPGDWTWFNATNNMTAWWTGFSDGAGSGVASTDWMLTTTSNCTGPPVSMVTNAMMPFNKSGLALSNGTTYYNCVRAIDGVGNTGDWVPSTGVTIDNQGPRTVTAAVGDGTTGGMDLTWWNQIHSSGANWGGFNEPGGESGIASYEFNLSTAATCTGDVVAPVNVGNVTSYSWNNAGITLLNVNTYFSCVRAWDVAGNPSAWKASNGFTIDTVNPTLGSVNDGGGAVGTDVAWWNSSNSMSANWTGFADGAQGSGIKFYEWGVSSSSTCASLDIGGPFNEGTANLVVTQGVSAMSSGPFYYNCVRATDNAGNTSAYVASNGVRIDTSGPTGGTVNDGPAPGDVGWWNQTNTFTGNWSAFNDGQSGVANYDFAVATDNLCNTRIVTAINLGLVSQATVAPTLTHGSNYWGCVRGTDVAGNVGNWVASSGFSVDTMAPPAPTGLNVTSSSNKSVGLSWTGVMDTLSGTQGYDVYYCAGAACMPNILFGNVAGTSTTVTGLTNCTTYNFFVKARDNAGNTSGASNTVSAQPVTATPTTPTVVPGAGEFAWGTTAVPGATSYQICYGSGSNPCSTGTIQGVPGPSGWVLGAPRNTAQFSMRAIDSGCQSAATPDVSLSLFSLQSINNTLGTLTNEWKGYAVAMIGDVNNDGKSDVAVSTGFGSEFQPSVHVYSGASPGTELWNATNPGAGGGRPFAYWGATLGSGGDIDGDGTPDLLSGAITFAPDFSSANDGAWAAFKGQGSGGASSQLCSGGFSSPYYSSGQVMGASMNVIGDLNNDGRAEFLVTGYGSSSLVGRVEVYSYSAGVCSMLFGGPILDPNNNGCGGIGCLFGYGGTGIGDYDGDGKNEFVVVAPQKGANGTAYVFSGGTGTSLTTFTGPTMPTSLRLTGAINAAGDVDGDGIGDVIAGVGTAYNAPTGAVVYSGKDFHIIYNLPSFNTSANDNFGSRVGAAGDVNGDGYADFYVTAYTTTIGGNANSGSIYVFAGGPANGATSATLLYELDGTAGLQLGASIAGGGDVNGDGRPDLVVGAYQYACSGAGSSCGEWWLWGPNQELRMTPAEFASPFLPQGYGGMQMPFVNGGGSNISFGPLGGTGSITASLLTNNSGGSITTAGFYTAGASVNKVDTVRMTDALNRQFDTRVFVNGGGGKPILPRPFGLKTTGSGSGTLSVSWVLPPVVGPVPIVEYKQALGTWTSVTLPANSTTYTVSGPGNMPYRVRVKLQGSTDSLWSGQVQGVTGP